MKTREYQPTDRDRVLALGNRRGVLDTPANRVIVLEEGGEVKGSVVWVWPGLIDSTIPTLGGISISEPNRRDIYDALLEAACDAAMAAGHRRGQAFVLTDAVLALMRQTFRFDAWALGTDVETRRPSNWVIEFDLAENKAILEARRR